MLHNTETLPQLLKLRITARSPLAFARRKPGTQFQASLGYIPGAALYGALGQWFGQHEKFDSTLFRAIRCHNAYPAHPDDSWVYPLPATAIQPKGQEEEDKSELSDSLVARICWEYQQPTALIYAPTDEDGRPFESAGGSFCNRTDFQSYRVPQRVLTRVAINRRRSTAEPSRLYSPMVLSEVMSNRPTSFIGSVVVFHDTSDMQQALQEVTHVGGRQTTGLGAISIEPTLIDTEPWQTIQQRVARLTEQFQQQITLYSKLGGQAWEIADETIFTVNLIADAILYEQGWLPTNELSAQLLQEYTGIKAQLLRSFTRTGLAGGWNVVWQRPKPTTITTTMGSVFVFHARRPLDTAAYQRLAQLQLDGIGERREEGYGQVRICDEFHLQESGENV